MGAPGIYQGEPSIIIGIDAGATFAFAALNFNGEIVAIRSKRNAKRGDILRLLEPLGPVIIASDTNPPAKLARWLSAAFKCKLSFPPKSMTQMDKIRMTRSYNFKNTHERDALAGALKAYFKIANKMRQVERHYREGSIRSVPEISKKLVATGNRMSEI
ncbi:MAG: DUF460 domain-containing protein [Candidatus Micrarchaeota archaeon]